jgi:hypothetical protein
MALLADLDDDGEDEVAVPLAFGNATVYSRRPDGWHEVGTLSAWFGRVDDLRARLGENVVRPLPPARYHGVTIGEDRFVFTPCRPSDAHCADASPR